MEVIVKSGVGVDCGGVREGLGCDVADEDREGMVADGTCVREGERESKGVKVARLDALNEKDGLKLSRLGDVKNDGVLAMSGDPVGEKVPAEGLIFEEIVNETVVDAEALPVFEFRGLILKENDAVSETV